MSYNLKTGDVTEWEITLDDYSKTPKYRQLVNSISHAIEDGLLRVGDKLPSVNRLLIEHDISRVTVVRAYDLLKKKEVIESVPGKGYYVKLREEGRRPRILLLFNKLSAHKKLIYDAFSRTLGEEASIYFYVYNNDFNLFKNIIQTSLGKDYTHYVLISHFLEGGENALDVIGQIPPEKLVILDKQIEGISGELASIYQDFERDIYCALTEMRDKLSSYQRLKLIFPDDTYHPVTIKDGFLRFCAEYAFNGCVVSDIATGDIRAGDAFINLMEDDLVTLIKRSKELKLKIGEEVGIISYNETLLKEVLLNGITTVSTDFGLLGQTAAECILHGRKERIANPFHVKFRNSL
ncbi:DNA-binding transcriptional regulator YhcF (GntR family) [Lewinella aquimaris]|uniref:DNA-binding transcriptional regulator YhcF (GntR family) n=1 Tax=Neolewinella aquimaris TaxID=1835722 RepID=A0A840EGP0_9BACT|nr:GntR family transcriptional regulator [Neolewinella aquimaris]MBB4080979.1 DNA-binding transcriptional regulator YhcF (GntR family) [Neolewinella aquimaris]